MAETKKLFDQFAPVTPEEWRAKAEVDLKGADSEADQITPRRVPLCPRNTLQQRLEGAPEHRCQRC